MTSAKQVDISNDSGSTWNTLPGGEGSFSSEAGSIEDTIFGQAWQSTEIGLIGWSVEAQALYKGFAGYKAKVKQAGSPTSVTGESMSQVNTSSTWKIDDATKEIWDRSATITVFDDSTDVTSDVEAFNYLFGEVTFVSGSEPTGSVTIDVSYFPVNDLGKANSFDLTQTAEEIDNTDFGTAQSNGGFRTFKQGLRTVSLDLSGFFDVNNGFRDSLKNREEVIIELNPDGNGKSIARGFFRLATEEQSGEVGALEEESTTFELNVPSNDFIPFGWQHESDTTLDQSVVDTLNAWENANLIKVRYLYDGVNGIKGDAVITEISLSGGLEAMNEFTPTFQGSGAWEAVGTG